MELTTGLKQFILLCFCAFTQGLRVQDLNGLWVLSDQQGNYTNLKAHVPGGIYTDLENNTILTDVFFGLNDVTSRWVSKTNWTYFRTFLIDQNLLSSNVINVVFDGLDTFSTVFVNGEKVGESDNMFVRYVFDVKNKLHLGVNNISVEFESPVEKAAKLYDEQALDYDVPPTCVPKEYQGECHANHARKMQASFAWDWGPAFPSVGIWKPIYIEAYNYSVIRDITVKTDLNNNTDNWNITIKTYLVPGATDTIKGTLLVKLFTDLGSVLNSYELNVTENNNGDFLDVRTFSIPKLQVQLWWPNGYGNATLYKLQVTYASEDQTEEHIKEIKIGFRTIRLDQHQRTKGRAFYFVVNDAPIFAKGSNIIPIDILPERGQNPATIRYLLESAKAAHMNMLRVWGGGVYESDEFYNVADELGILIWQDFMFACSMYPTNANFIKTVEQEVIHQVRRLQHHPSVAIWAGNNENEAALRQNWYGTAKNFSLYKDDFIKLYVDTIEPLVLENDNSREFLTSSPTNGIQSVEEDYVAQNPQDPLYGDVHFYNYIQDSWDVNVYPIPRFASEYGYQSLPALKTLTTITNNSADLAIGGKFMEHRQHHNMGYLEMQILMNKRLMLPNTTDEAKFTKTYIFYGQIMQAMAIKIETEHYRRWKSFEDTEQRGFTMGALYWQLNDVWVAPTWAGIDYKLNWKMLHYFATEFFAPVIITSHLTPDRELTIVVVNDKLNSFDNATARLIVYNWNNFTAVHSEDIVIPDISSNHGVKVTSFWLDTYLVNANCGNLASAKFNCFLRLSLLDNNGSELAPNNYAFPAPLKETVLKSANVTIASVEDTGNNGREFKITIKSDIIALFVWLDTNSIRGKFSENGFNQVEDTKVVYFWSDDSVSVNALQQELSLTYYMDPQYI